MSDLKNFPYKLYLVTDKVSCLGRDLLQVTEQAVMGGVDVVQLREKHLSDREFLDKALRMKELLDKYNVPLIINDNIWVAEQSSAYGVHVGNADTPPFMIREKWPHIKAVGWSIEYVEQLSAPDTLASDYIALSPVFSTLTKTNTITEWKLEGITQIRNQTTKPIVAIGGINETNAAAAIAAGADCLAVVSAICSAEHPAKAAERLRNLIEKGK